MAQIMLVQPVTVKPTSFVMSVTMMATKLTALTSMPASVMRRSGFTERLVMPSKAKASIFFSG